MVAVRVGGCEGWCQVVVRVGVRCVRVAVRCVRVGPSRAVLLTLEVSQLTAMYSEKKKQTHNSVCWPSGERSH